MCSDLVRYKQDSLFVLLLKSVCIVFKHKKHTYRSVFINFFQTLTLEYKSKLNGIYPSISYKAVFKT